MTCIFIFLKMYLSVYMFSLYEYLCTPCVSEVLGDQEKPFDPLDWSCGWLWAPCGAGTQARVLCKAEPFLHSLVYLSYGKVLVAINITEALTDRSLN